MKAYTRTNSKNQEVVLQNVAIPTIQDHEVLIQVKAFGVGIHDRYFIPGGMGFGEAPEFPYVIGSEGAGIITQLGDKVTGYSVGDKVIFTTVLQAQGGSRAEFAVASQDVLIPLPESLSFEQGAAIPIAGKTAIDAFKALDLRQDEYLFIAGASGAIGSLIIQMAKRVGALVASSASAANQEYMKNLGSNMTVDYRDQTRKAHVKDRSHGGVDKALAIQPGTVQDSMELVKDGGKVITVSGLDQTTSERNIMLQQFTHSPDSMSDMRALVQDIAQGILSITIEQVYDFDDALSALQKTETRHARGKLVVQGISMN